MISPRFRRIRIEIGTLGCLVNFKRLSMTLVNILSKRSRNQDLMVPIGSYHNFGLECMLESGFGQSGSVSALNSESWLIEGLKFFKFGFE